jgi:ABC-2 type transport system ATP-binding protein
MELLTLHNVSKAYHSHQALEDVSLTIPQGSIYGLLGPNGAGKTTLIRIITTIIKADSGSVAFNGEELERSHTQHIGYLPEERGLYHKMSVKDNVLFFAQLNGLSKEEALQRLDAYLQEFELTPWKEEEVENLSKGMQQKIQFILTVLHEPRLLILDEPFSGLDPINTELLQNKVRELRDKGTTVIFSTHRMEQVESLCEEIGLISEGQKLIEGAVTELKHQFKPHQMYVEFAREVPADLETQFEIAKAPSSTERIIQLQGEETPQDVLRVLAQTDSWVTSFQEVLPSLQDIFVENVTNA